jgi:hypothetical protein
MPKFFEADMLVYVNNHAGRPIPERRRCIVNLDRIELAVTEDAVVGDYQATRVRLIGGDTVSIIGSRIFAALVERSDEEGS